MKFSRILAILMAASSAAPIYGAQAPLTSALDAFLFGETHSFGAILEVDGKSLYSRYGDGFRPESKQLFWSAAKSVLGTLVGMAIEEGKMSWDTRLCDVLPEWKERGAKARDGSDLCAVSVEHLMYWESGIRWSETYEKEATTSHVVEMLFGPSSRDMASFVLGKGMARTPGSFVNYSSGDTVVLARMLRGVYAPSVYASLLRERVAAPLGLKNFVMEQDASGTYVGSSFLYASLPDMLEFGRLYLERGSYRGRRLLSEAFVERVTRPHARFEYQARLPDDRRAAQAGHWWSNRPYGGKGERPWPSWPEDTFAAQGHWGQALIVVPSKKILFVRTGDDRQGRAFWAEELGKRLKSAGIL